jgi:Domain of unknown function (DUF4303)
METTRVACVRCGNKILPDTAARNNGLCGVCERKRAKLAAKAAMDNDILIIRYADEFSTLREMTRDVVRSAFLDLERLCAGECLYGLCIYAYKTVGGPPVFCGSTLAGFAKRESKLRADTELHKMLPNMPVQEIVFTSGKWSPYEWEYEAHRWSDFRAIVDYVENIAPKQDDNSPNELHAMALAAYVASLYDLDQENLFARHRQLSSLVLFCSDCESSDREWYEHASAKFLNPPEFFNIFYNESVVFDAADEEHNRELLGDECQRRFNTYLQLVCRKSDGG